MGIITIRIGQTGPPGFYLEDINKWQKKFEPSVKSENEQMERFRRTYKFSNPHIKNAYAFSNVDAILVRGNSGKVSIEII